MKPVVAIVGRPNVGKSTLFNRFTHSRDALVAPIAGLTRDRKYGTVSLPDHEFLVVDTGGLSGEDAILDVAMAEQTRRAVDEAELVLFLVDAQVGVTPRDADIGAELRRYGKKVLLVVNKIDGEDSRSVTAEFHDMGLGQPIGIAASQGRNLKELTEAVVALLPGALRQPEAEDEGEITKIAIVGRPNAGKSTLVNQLLGENRVVASEVAGTTRDSVYVPFAYRDQRYMLIDTAGLRRRARVKETAEKFSIVQTLKAIDDANVVILMLDAVAGIADQDLTILGQVMDAGKGLLIAVNKWDGVEKTAREYIESELDRRLDFINYADIHFISALQGKGIGKLMKSASAAYESARRSLVTGQLSRLLEQAVQQHQPPLVRGRRIKLRYAHQGGSNPPIIVIHGSQTQHLPSAYVRFLENFFRAALKLAGTPLRLEFKNAENPFAGRHNKLTPRQEYKRKRLIKFHKKQKK